MISPGGCGLGWRPALWGDGGIPPGEWAAEEAMEAMKPWKTVGKPWENRKTGRFLMKKQENPRKTLGKQTMGKFGVLPSVIKHGWKILKIPELNGGFDRQENP